MKKAGKVKIMLCGPVLGNFERAYGGGTGGYTRKMKMYLELFRSDAYEFYPCFHTIRGQYRFGFFVVRFFLDLWFFVFDLFRINPDIVHILAQYRAAIIREYIWVCIARLRGIPVVYEIKAGVFIKWYQAASPLSRYFINYILRKSKVVLCQGKAYVNFVKSLTTSRVSFHPNFIDATQMPEHPKPLFPGEELKVLFVGFAFHAKGVFELVEACEKVASAFPVRLTMVGKEHPEFAAFLDQRRGVNNFSIVRKGLLSHKEVAEQYLQNDVYCYPTRHIGEGHNNTITEAMMYGMVVISTPIGFIGDIVQEHNGYPILDSSVESIVQALHTIYADRETARKKGAEAYETAKALYTTKAAFLRLEESYAHCSNRNKNILEADIAIIQNR